MIPEKKFSVVIVAGGKGVRAGSDLPKQFSLIGGKPMLMHTITAFYNYDYRINIVVVLPEDFTGLWSRLCAEYNFEIQHTVVTGGETRFHSVKNGLKEISDIDTVAIHDGARPFVSPEVIGRCYEESFQKDIAVIPVVDLVDSVRMLSESDSKIVDRSRLKIIQTPQVFPASMLKKAYETEYSSSFTDDASVVEMNGENIHLVEGDSANIKITTQFDLVLAEFYFNKLPKR